jgi:hypothetical protein
VKKFEQTASVIANKKGVFGRKKSVRTPQEVFTRSPSKFIKRLSQQLRLKQTSTLTIAQKD